MDEFLWKKSYEIGCSLIDEQHQSLFGFANAVVNAAKSGDHELLDNTIQDLFDYTVYHFNSEERYMHELGFPHLEDHRHEHKVLIQTLRSRIADSKSKEELGDLLVEFMTSWILHHILEEDQQVSRFVTSRSMSKKA